MLVELGSTAEIREGVPTVFKVHGREVLVTRWRGRFYALKNVCAHRAVALSNGGHGADEGCRGRRHVGDFVSHVGDFVTGGDDIGEWHVRADVPVIKCPWHSWQYRLTDGGCMSDPRLRVRSYKVVVQDDKIFVEMGRAEDSHTTPSGPES